MTKMETKKLLFSSKVRFVYIVDNKANFFQDTIIVFDSDDFETAFKFVLDTSKLKEKSYFNIDNKEVIFKLKEILTLDIINLGEKISFNSKINFDVYSENIDIDNELFDFDFKPEKSDPFQTI